MKNKKPIYIYLLIIFSFISLISCKKNGPIIKNEDIEQKNSHDFLGTYTGIQPSYFLKDKYGDDMILNGNKVPVSSAEYKYLFQKDNFVSMKQTSIESNTSYFYEGSYSIKSEDKNTLVLECKLHYKETNANPTHTITINLVDKRAVAKGDDGTDVELKSVNQL